MIYLLFLCVFALMILSGFIFKKDITSPAFLMTAGFTVSLLCCCLYANQWMFHDYRLFFVVFLGLLSFVIFSGLTFSLEKEAGKKSRRQTENDPSGTLRIPQIKLVLYLAFQSIMVLIHLFELYKNFGMGSLAAVIGYYYNANNSGTLAFKSSLLGICNILNMPAVYIILYIMAYNISHKMKCHILLWVNVGFAAANSLLDGTRTTFFMYVVAFLVMYMIQRQRVTGEERNINLKNVIKAVGVFIVGIVCFVALLSLQGRVLSDITVVDLVANYLGAPVKNLEFSIEETANTAKQFGETTFIDTYSWLNDILGYVKFEKPNVYRYRWINGKILGNVYTQFMPLYRDFGIAGVIVIMGFLGFFCQKIYNCVRINGDRCGMDYTLLFYSYLAFAIIFSFYSNKFFELIFARAIIYNMVGVVLFDIFFFRLKLKNGHFVIETK